MPLGLTNVCFWGQSGFTNRYLPNSIYEYTALVRAFSISWLGSPRARRGARQHYFYLRQSTLAAMDWRQLIAAMVGTIALILGIASLMEAPVHKPDPASHQNTADKAKAAPVRALRASDPFEFPAPWDEGSLWDQGPAYDLSR